GLVAGPDPDLVAVGIDGNCRDTCAGEEQCPRRRVATGHDPVRAGGPGREADEVSALQRALSAGLADRHRSLDDEQPLLLVLVVVGALPRPGRECVHVHRGSRRPRRAGDIDPAFVVLCAEDVDHRSSSLRIRSHDARFIIARPRNGRCMRLEALNVGPAIPVSDMAASRSFYEGMLGLQGEAAPGGYALRGGGGTPVFPAGRAAYTRTAEG